MARKTKKDQKGKGLDMLMDSILKFLHHIFPFIKKREQKKAKDIESLQRIINSWKPKKN